MIGLTYETLKMRNQVHQVKEELIQELSKENGKDDTELRNFAAKFNRQDATAQLQYGAGSLETAQLELPNDELLWRPRLRRLPRGASQTCGTLTRRVVKLFSYPITKRSEQCSLPGDNGPFRGSSCGTGRATRRWLQP